MSPRTHNTSGLGILRNAMVLLSTTNFFQRVGGLNQKFPPFSVPSSPLNSVPPASPASSASPIHKRRCFFSVASRSVTAAAVLLSPGILGSTANAAKSDNEGMGVVLTLTGPDGRAKQYAARPLPAGFEKGLTLPITDITEQVFGPPDGDRAIELAASGPDAYPYSAKDMKRLDESDDGNFYDEPRLVYHIDAGAVAALTHYYQTTVDPSPPGFSVLDICSSWVSHYPLSFAEKATRIAGTGMNALELSANVQFSGHDGHGGGDFSATDLNRNPKLPYDDASFDIVTCVVSVDYLSKPLEVFREVHRILKPGGRFILSQSNRLFYTKAVARWLALDDLSRLELIGDYFHYSVLMPKAGVPGEYVAGFEAPRAFDISARGKGAKDPMYIVEARKRAGKS